MARIGLGFDRQAEFGKAIGGFAFSQIGRAERGENFPPPEMLLALLNRCGVDLNWLMTGKGEMWTSPVPGMMLRAGIAGESHYDPDYNRRIHEGSAKIATEKAAATESPKFRPSEIAEPGYHLMDREEFGDGPKPENAVPVLGTIAAGPGIEPVEAVQFSPGDARRFIIYKVALSGAFALLVGGDSMQPVYYEGDLILVDPNQRAESGVCAVRYRRKGEGLVALKALRRIGKRIILESLNPRHKPLELARADFEGAFKIVDRLPFVKKQKPEGGAQ